MSVQIHLTGAKARLAITANQAAAQKAIADGNEAPGPAPKPIPWAGFSGRGVRLRTLDPDEKEAAAASAAADVGENATLSAYNRRRSLEGVHRCLLEVTREKEIADLGGATWVRVTIAQLESASPKEPMRSSALFTPKDIDFLGAWFREMHDASSADLEAIMGGAQELADDAG
jgi:hypothetical protein